MKINPQFSLDIKKYGGMDLNACFNCGSCTAICPLSTAESSFPRKMVRASVLGLEDKINCSLDPWLCFYCGECSETCPKEADPGGLMMALRRYLTSLYDWTGLSKKFYTSHAWEFGAIALVSLLVITLFALFLPPTADPTGLLNQEGGVKINSFVEGMEGEQFVGIIDIGDWVMGGIISLFLLSNIFNMFRKVLWRDKNLKIPLYLYLQEAWNLFFHFATQISFSKCRDKGYWVFHWLLMSGYTLMFTCIVILLPWFQTEKVHPFFHPQRLIGYYATFGILLATVLWSVQRLKKSQEKHRYSHITDWLFLILLFLTALTGILVHLFRINGMIYPTYYTYVVHMAILVPMLVIEVPFSKWTHLAYRPVAIYLHHLKNSALELAQKQQK
ncbi:MAG: 4Fe-4S dicluster domain-containing protein [Candidatus Krumholzibacteriota bacterium]|nr:4Fe-4S dicluster domain-containing protein [Candidatus Krumholzibacteriota bacterium]